MKRPSLFSADDHADVLIAEVYKIAEDVLEDLRLQAMGTRGLRSKASIERAADVFVRRLRLEGLSPEQAANRATIIALTVAIPVAMQFANERR